MDNNFSKVKISDIAKRAGVSAGTVDRVIHNRGEVALKTRDKVLKIIGEMNYEPDILASTLASKKSYRFVAILPEADKANPFWESPAMGLQKAWDEIRHFGISLDKYFFSYTSRESFQAKLKEVLQQPPSGVILAPIFTEQSVAFMEQLSRIDIPAVFLNTILDDQKNIAFVGQDPRHSGMVAASLLRYGLRDDAEILLINIISEKGGNSHILKREEGFREFFRLNNGSPKPALTTLNITTTDPAELETTLQNTLGNKTAAPRSKGVFVSNSKVFLVADFIEKAGLKNIKLIGYDLLKQNQDFLKKGVIDFLISQQPQEQGYKSVMALFNHLVMKKQIVKNQYLPIDIITKENIDFYINQ